MDHHPIVVRNVRKRLAEYAIDQDTNEAVPATISYCNADEELRCGICLGTIDKTWTVIACIHRFCSDCLHRSLRMDLGSQKANHECPLCRVKIPSRRASKPDQNFDALIGILLDEKDGGTAVTTSTLMTSTHDTAVVSTNDGEDDDLGGGGGRTRRGGAGAEGIQLASPTLDISAFRKVHEENVRRFRQRSEAMRTVSQQNGHSGSSPRSMQYNAYLGEPSYNHNSRGASSSAQSRHGDQEQGEKYLQQGGQHFGSSAGASSRQSMKRDESDYVQWSLEPLDTVSDGRPADSKSGIAGAVHASDEEFKLQKPYLRCSASLTMADVKAYLSQKFCTATQTSGDSSVSLEEEHVAATAVVQARAIELFTRRRQQMNLMVAVADDLTLRDVCMQHWDAQSELNLFFRINPTKS